MRARVRDFEVVADEPASSGGTDTGPMPTELLLSSLAVCFTMALYHAFRKRNVELPDLEVHVDADYAGLRLSKIRVATHSSHPREELEAMLPRAISYCYVSNTLSAGCEVEYSVADGPLTGGSAPARS